MQCDIFSGVEPNCNNFLQSQSRAELYHFGWGSFLLAEQSWNTSPEQIRTELEHLRWRSTSLPLLEQTRSTCIRETFPLSRAWSNDALTMTSWYSVVPTVRIGWSEPNRYGYKETEKGRVMGKIKKSKAVEQRSWLLSWRVGDKRGNTQYLRFNGLTSRNRSNIRGAFLAEKWVSHLGSLEVSDISK